MAITLDSISRGKARKAPRIVLTGIEKIGKSTFANQAPSPIFIPMKGEQGIDEIDCARFPTCNTFDDVMGCLQSLYQEAHEYRTAVIDSASALEPIIWDQTCRDNNAVSIEKVGGGFGKGYVEAVRYWRDLTAALDYLRDDKGMGCVIIGHVKAKPFNDPLTDPYDTYIFDIHERPRDLLYRWADCILFANYKTFTKKVAEKGDNKIVHATGTGERVVYTQKRPGHPGGNRYGLPYELPLTYAAFEAELRKSEGGAPTQQTAA